MLVSSGSAGKRIKCPKCERKLRVPSDVVEKRRAQLEARQGDAKPVPQRSKIEKPLSSLVDLPDPEPPPILATVNEPIAATNEQQEKPKSLEVSKNSEPLQLAPEHKADTPKRPPPLPRTLSVRGYEADRDKIATVRWLAAAILITSLVGMVPAAIDVIEHMLSDTSNGVSRWACGLLLVGVLQCAYAVYLVQLPDWSSVGVVTVFTLAIAAGYAALFGLTLLSSDQGHFVQILDLADRLRGGKATAWCLIMLSLMSLTSYFSGRIGVRWRNAFVG